MSSPGKPDIEALKIARSEKRRGQSLWLWLSLIILAIILALLFWWFNRPRPLRIQAVTVRETTTSSSTDRTVLNASGYVTARREATVSSKVTGKVVEVLVEEGMHVKEGQILARLDDTNVKANLQLAQAQLKSARAAVAETQARIKEAEANLQRTAALARNSISAQADLDHAEADTAAIKARFEQQQAEIVVAEKQVAAWEQQMDDNVIRAPFSGVVTSKNAQPGEMISPISAGGGFTRTGICTIVDMQSLEIEIDVNESYINRVQPEQPVEATLDAYPNWKIPCRVIAIIPTADRQKSTVKVRVGLVQLDPRILPEMSVKVAFHEAVGRQAERARSFTVPRRAVQEREGRNVVFVVKNGKAEMRAITVQAIEESEIKVSAGLSAGERVVMDAPNGLKDGDRVIDEAEAGNSSP